MVHGDGLHYRKVLVTKTKLGVVMGSAPAGLAY